MHPAALWKRYLRFYKDPVYQAVLTTLCLAGVLLSLHPLHAVWANLALACGLALVFVLDAWHDKRVARRDA